MSDPRHTDAALHAITRDLNGLQRDRRRHFGPALAFAAVVVAGLLLAIGLRSDFLAQPPWQVAFQLLAWAVCLVLFPAIGVGLWFPGRLTRFLVAVGGGLLSLLAATGWPAATPDDRGHDGPCWIVLAGCGLVLLAIGALSGAFAQRRARAAAFWIAGGIALAALEVVTWICPNTESDHLVRMHLLPTLAVVAFAAAVGVVLHRLARSRG